MTARDRIVIMIVLAIGAVAAAWMLVVSPKRDQASKLSGQIATQQTQLDAVRSQAAAAENARTSFAGQYAQLAKLGEAVPPDDQIPSLIYQVQSAAQAAHVSFRGLQLTPGSSSGPSAPATTSSTPSTSGSGSTGSSAPDAGSQLPPGAAVGAAGLPTEQFTFTLTGNFFHLANFFNRLQNFVITREDRLLVSGRLMTINAINLVPGQTGFPQISATVSATTYMIPATQGAVGGATPAGPASAPPTKASTSGPPTPAPAAAITPLR